MKNFNSEKLLLIIGAGGFGREVLSYIEDDNPIFNIKGFLDNRFDILKNTPRNAKIIGDPLSYIPNSDEIFVVALGDPQKRFEYTKNLREIYFANFIRITHPTSNISRHARVSHGSIIAPRVGISVDVEIGEFTNIQEYTVIGHDAKIGNWCQINSHCTIAGGAKIGNFVTIHPNCVITNRAVIGDNVTVAAGSVVVGKIPDGITVLGNPAKKFSFK